MSTKSFLLALFAPLLIGATWFWFTAQNQLFTTGAMVRFGHDDWHTLLLLFVLNIPVYGIWVYIAALGTMVVVKTPRLKWADLGLATLQWNCRIAFLVVAGVLALLLGQIGAGVASAWMQRLGYVVVNNRSTLITNFAHLPLSRGFMVLLLCVVAPISEEIFFRGFVQRSLTRVLPPWLAVLVSSAVFACAHLDPASACSYFASGIVFGSVFQISKSLWLAIFLHMVVNTIFVLLTFAVS